VASQGKTEQEALQNLEEALELYYEPPTASQAPQIYQIQVNINAA
jgi:predicted RNase H-like HicB family nuclease